MSATTIPFYGGNGQKDVCSSRMLKKSASGVLASFRASTYPKGTPRLFTRCGLAGRPFSASCGNVLYLTKVCGHRSFVFPTWFSRSLLGLEKVSAIGFFDMTRNCGV